MALIRQRYEKEQNARTIKQAATSWLYCHGSTRLDTASPIRQQHNFPTVSTSQFKFVQDDMIHVSDVNNTPNGVAFTRSTRFWIQAGGRTQRVCPQSYSAPTFPPRFLTIHKWMIQNLSRLVCYESTASNEVQYHENYIYYLILLTFYRLPGCIIEAETQFTCTKTSSVIDHREISH